MRIEKISAVTLKVASMLDSVRFYQNVLGMELSSEGKTPLSLRFAPSTQRTYPNLEQGRSVPGWGRMIST